MLLDQRTMKPKMDNELSSRASDPVRIAVIGQAGVGKSGKPSFVSCSVLLLGKYSCYADVHTNCCYSYQKGSESII